MNEKNANPNKLKVVHNNLRYKENSNKNMKSQINLSISKVENKNEEKLVNHNMTNNSKFNVKQSQARLSQIQRNRRCTVIDNNTCEKNHEKIHNRNQIINEQQTEKRMSDKKVMDLSKSETFLHKNIKKNNIISIQNPVSGNNESESKFENNQIQGKNPNLNNDNNFTAFDKKTIIIHNSSEDKLLKEEDLNINEFKSINLNDDKQKWRDFSFILAKSYDGLKEKYSTLKNELDQKNEIIDILNKQIELLKTQRQSSDCIISSFNAEDNKEDKENKENSLFLKENEHLKLEIKNLKEEKDIQFKKIEELSQKLKHLQEKYLQLKQYKGDLDENDLAKKYKMISQKNLKMCSIFAEQIICLRSDLEENVRRTFSNKKDSCINKSLSSNRKENIYLKLLNYHQKTNNLLSHYNELSMSDKKPKQNNLNHKSVNHL